MTNSFSSSLLCLNKEKIITLFSLLKIKGYSKKTKRQCVYKLVALSRINNNIKKQILAFISAKTKKNIPDSLRAQVYTRYILSLDDEERKFYVRCPCCQNVIIDPFSFECGHILAESKGGGINIDNLIPLCRVCNRGMNVESVRDYMKKYFPRNELPTPWR